ncbi:MAG: c-type cytochrome [Acidobacteriia bacterium]|nr:c-type cytochrome [Terriglobia bacterium]
MKLRHILGLLVLSLAVGGIWAQEQQKTEQKPAPEAAAAPAAPQLVHGFKLTPEDAAKKNPIKFTTNSVERGKKIYTTQCAMCHGEKGDGKGEVVEEMKLNPPDFTKPEVLSKRTDGDLFAIIGGGSELMPGQGKRLTDTHKWNLVNYLRSLSGKSPERSTGKEPEENIILVPQKE